MDEQSFIKRKRILEAIDALRERKNRPDIGRIGNYLFRRYKVPPRETKSDLEWCVSNKSVLRVEYKGAISYRNALKKKRKRSKIDFRHKPSISKSFMELLTNVFAELAMEEPHYLEDGVPATEIIQLILEKEQYTKSRITMLLEGQVKRKNLIRLENGNFMLGPCSSNKNKKIAVLISKNKECQPHSKLEPPKISRGRGRPPKISGQEQTKKMQATNPENIKEGIQKLSRRLKIAKKVFDPSDAYAPKTSRKNILNKHAHPSKSLKKSYTDDDDWKPSSHYSTKLSRVEAEVCLVCDNASSEKNAKMVTCMECSNKAHHVCLRPNITDKIEKWLCENCQGEEEMNSDNDKHSPKRKNYSKFSKNMEESDDEVAQSDSSTPESPSQSPVPSGSGIQKKNLLESSKLTEEGSSDCSSLESPVPSVSSIQEKTDSNSPKSEVNSENLDLSIPDPSHWTPDEVYEYFAKIISEDEAKIFREEGIDGRSLLCLKRNDLLNHLKLDLDPALEVFRHITMLQKTDPSDNATQSAHPARFSPEDQYSRQRIIIKSRYGILKTQTPEPVY